MFHSPMAGNWDIYYKKTSNGGAHWTADERLTDDPSVDVVPTITLTADGRIWVAFASLRAGNYDIWYKVSVLEVVHDVAITSVSASPTTVNQGETVTILVGVANEGTVSETFTVTAYADTIEIGSTNVTLDGGNSTILTFIWNTTNVAVGNYTIKAYATIVEGETDTADNFLTDGTVHVRIPGDANGDGTVDLLDAVMLIQAYGTSDPNADFNDDGVVDIVDVDILMMHYGETAP